MSAPVVVNTTDGTVWTRRDGSRDGEALYAPEKCGTCPAFVMVTLTELAELGIVGSADALPVPVGPEPLSAERLADIAARAGIATEGPWHVVEGHEIHQGAEFGDFAVYVAQTDPDCGCVQSVADAEFIAHAREDVPALLADNERLRARVAELEAERAKYVGKEPTIAEEMAYLFRCIDSVLDLCSEAESKGITSGGPFTVEAVRRAADGLVERTSYPPALPWAALMDDEDLQEFLGDLLDSLNSNPPSTRAVLAEVEKTCSTWRLVAEAQHGHNTAPGPDAVTRVFAPVASLREPDGEPSPSFAERAAAETDPARRTAWRMLARDVTDGEHYPLVHHDYQVSHDLPETGGAR